VGKHMSEIVSGPLGKRHPIWPVAIIAFGVSLTAAWVGLLGYGLVKLIERAI
jgi:hypothetical protein